MVAARGNPSTISVLSFIYGAPSQQLTSFLSRIEKGQGQYDKNDHTYAVRIAKDIAGVADTALADWEFGLTASVQLRAKGAVLGDFVARGREALAEPGDGPDRVAAVLAAAALEETLKQMGVAAGLDVHNRAMPSSAINAVQSVRVLTLTPPAATSDFYERVEGKLSKVSS